MDWNKVRGDLDTLQNEIENDNFSSEKISTKTPVHSVLSSLAIKLEADRIMVTKAKGELAKKFEAIEKSPGKTSPTEILTTSMQGYELLSNVSESDGAFFLPKVRAGYEKICEEKSAQKNAMIHACDKAVELTMYEMYKTNKVTPFAKKFHAQNCETSPDFKHCPKLAFASAEFLGDKTWMRKQCESGKVPADFKRYCDEKLML